MSLDMRFISSQFCDRLLVACMAWGVAAATSSASLPVVDDELIRKDLVDKVGALVDDKKATSGEELVKQLSRKSCSLKLPKPSSAKKDSIYDTGADSVVALGSVYKCSKCTEWHGSGAATAWVLTEDGVMVTNYHVFDGKTVPGFGVRTRDGRVAPVVEILAADKLTDVAIFRVEGSGFKPLAFGPDAKVGSDIHIVAHPDTRFYSFTSGQVSRYYRKHMRGQGKPVLMAVTADFARGSSGGPVMDDHGNVVGMVTSTQSVYYPPKKKTDKKGPLQMVIKNCVPVSSIRALVKSEK